MREVIVVGGGPCGLSVGAALQELEIDYLILEKRAIVNSILSFPVNMRFYSTSDRLEIGNIPFLSEEDRPTRQEVLRYYRSVVSRQQMNILTFQHVINIERTLGGFLVRTQNHLSKEEGFEARRIVLATGIYDHPRLLDVPGERMSKVMHYYTEGHSYSGRRVLVAGGKNSAIEAVIDLYRNGAEVSLVHRGATVYQGIKPTLLHDIRNLIEKGKISFYPESTITCIEEDHVLIQSLNGPVKIQNDFVFSLIGYQPDLSMLSNLGIRLDHETQIPDFDPETYETNGPDIYVAGVITGGITNKVFIDDGRLHGPKIANHIAKQMNGS
ncbi:YpdA family putative bacillithiol disulfide reductase [Paenibacillus contaminans]|uniref:YpdA family putative bacillithiol disulfide reductase n=1 Tax=Paenibacillus contaminans TaxID=450362 RepID=A0A329MX17_9BACL|nr:YpdA family putative bacillithiol disulfide reductase [Paenibacillus contaminans]RAV23296.1 YpdA family putative bacillithiol disulfide reductase [Paenibacillus contaminans]